MLEQITEEMEAALDNGDVELAKKLLRRQKTLQKAVEETIEEEETERYVTAEKNKAWRPIKDPDAIGESTVQASKEPNQFTDNGTDHQDELNKTPEVTRVERRPPTEMKMVDALCWVCNRTERIESYRLTATGKFDSGENKGKSAYRCTNCCKSDRR